MIILATSDLFPHPEGGVEVHVGLERPEAFHAVFPFLQ